MATDELEERRRQRRAAVRAPAAHVRVILPHTDGEVTKALSDLEEVMLAANEPSYAPEDDTGLGVGPEALHAVGRLASYVASVERVEPAVQPVAPDGRFELVPLHYVLVGRDDLARIGGAADLVVKAVRQGIGDDELLAAVDGHGGDIDELALRLERLVHLLGLPDEPQVDSDIDALAAMEGTASTWTARDRPPTGAYPSAGLAGPAESWERRVVLSEAQFAAYQRLAERIMDVWHPGDPLGRFLFSGPPSI